MKRITWWLGAIGAVVALAGCGGGGLAPDEPSGAPAVVSLDTLGPQGGTVVGLDGASVEVPEGALDTEITIRVAADSTGAPSLTDAPRVVGNVYEVTPHGRPFDRPVTVRLPLPAVSLAPGESLVMLRADVGGRWTTVGGVDRDDGVLTADVDALGWFAVGVARRAQVLATSAPIAYTRTLDCGAQSCSAALGTVSATLTIASNGGFFPSGCGTPSVRLFEYSGTSLMSQTSIPLAGLVVRRTLARLPIPRDYRFVLRGSCSASTWTQEFGTSTVRWAPRPAYPNLAIERQPTGLQAAPGTSADLEIVFLGGAAQPLGDEFTVPTSTNRAVIDWERSDDRGGSWRNIGTSYQNESGNKRPYAGLPDWAAWTARIGIPVTQADAGALFRARACYAPPDVAAPPCVTSRSVALTLLQVTSIPQIATAPAPRLIIAGQTASFTAAATGLPAPTLQWQRRPANSTSGWVNILGGTGTSYTTPVLQVGSNGVQYRVVATNGVGSAASPPATVSVNVAAVAPSISTQPAAITVITGSDAVFAVRAAGTDALSFQWRHNGVNLTGANGAVLRLAAVDATKAGDYSVVVSNAVGSVTSAAARLTVSDVPVTVVLPTIVAGPAAASVAQGQSVTFTVGVTGTGPFGYQWRKDGTPIAGATGAAYSVTSAQPADAGGYSVVVSSGGVNVSSAAAVLTVTAVAPPVAPTITTQPVSVVVVPGATTTLAVAASGTGPLAYQWFQDGSPIAGANGPTLTLDSIASISNGSYTVTVGNALGSVTSAPAELLVAGAPQVGTVADVYEVPEGNVGEFTISASGSGLRYQWTRNRIAIPGATEATYTTPVLTLADSGAVYGVIVYNGAGLVIVEGTVLTVTPPPNPPGLVRFAGSFNETNNAASGDGTGTDARFNEPRGLVADASGNLYVANRNGGFVSKVTPGAVVTRIAEHGFSGALALGADGSLLSMQVAGGTQANLRVLAPLQAGAATQARTCGSPICGGSISPNRPFAAIAADGTVYTAWQDANFVSVTAGPLSDVNPPIAFFAGTTDLLNRPAGWVDGTGTDARFDAPGGIAIGPDGNVYVADTNNHVIRRITPATATTPAVVSTFAGTGTVAGSADGALLAATFNRPLNLGFDSQGALWVQEIGPAGAPRTSLRRIASGQVSTPVADLQAEIDAVAGGPGSPIVTNGFTRIYGGMAVIGPKRIAFSVTHALLVLTLP
jgi:hypothetical protein